eukprot:CAMPEP_0179004542 /NCGR_PEP_ID=MMETSP0795-20121207/13366_1 /TAXON_ID=88552 /ORGANISM="Amoebophrya sp., Strain Ameob2" /LENGTH=1339 /DNA_ID=CAMNT_0020698823 /DNA_START=193 /DNA_END=4212 /DNA_ORIENTATION=+
MAPKPKKKAGNEPEVDLPKELTFAEQFQALEPNQVTFSVTFTARCHPNMLDKVRIAFNWIDADLNGLNTPADGCPANLAAWEKNENASTASECQVRFTKVFAPATVTLELLYLLRSAVMSASIFCRDQAAGGCGISLAPLLLGTPEEGCEWPIRFPCKVFSTRRDNLRVPGLFSLETCVATDKPVLTEAMAKLLIPIFVEVKAVKDMPNEPWLPQKSPGVYAHVFGQLRATTRETLGKDVGAKIRTPLEEHAFQPHTNRVPLDAKMVFFLGVCANNLHVMREWLMNEALLIEVHDRDPAASSDESTSAAGSASEEQGGSESSTKKIVSPKISPHGLARFRLADFLLENSWDCTLRADLYPIRSNVKQRYKELKSEGLDPATLLERESRSKVQKLASTAELREFEPPYLDHGTFVQCRFVKRGPVPHWFDLQRESEVFRFEKILNASERRVVEEADGGDWRCFVYAAVDEKTGNKHFRWKLEDPNAPGDEPPPAGIYRLTQRHAERDFLQYLHGRLEEYLIPPDSAEQSGNSRPNTAKSAKSGKSGKSAKSGKSNSAVSAAGENDEPSGPQYEPLPGGIAFPLPSDFDSCLKEVEEIQGKKSTWLTTNLMDVSAGVTGDETGLDLRHERFGRLIYVLDIQNEKTATQVLRIVQETNQKATNLEHAHVSTLKNYELSEAERKDPEMDVLTGYVLLDKRCRIMVIEGLRKGGIKRLLEEIPRLEKNDEKNRLIGNNDVGFSDRLYLPFNLSLKHIKIRQNLEVLTGTKPELYDVTRCAPEIFTIVEQLRELKRATRIQHAKEYLNCFPTVECLTKLEILYGDYISDEELAGGISPEFAKKLAEMERERLEKLAEEAALNSNNRASNTTGSKDKAKEETIAQAAEDAGEGGEFPSAPESKRKQERVTRKGALDMQNTAFEVAEELRRSASVPNLVRKNVQTVHAASEDNTRLKSMSKVVLDVETFLDPAEEVFIYSGQKLQSSELQKQYMRKQMWDLQEKYMWTYSPIYNSSAFEFLDLPSGRPGNVAMREEVPVAASKVKFQYPKASTDEELKKLARDVTDYRKWELQTFPWAENEWNIMPVGVERRKPINGKKIFDADRVPHLREHNERPFDASLIERRIKEFGPKSMNETVHEAGDVYENAILERNKKEKEETEKGRIGPDVLHFYNKDYTRNGVTDLDRYDVVRKDYPAYRGIRFDQKFMPKGIKKKYGKHKILEKVLGQLPTSMRIAENWDETAPQMEFEARMRSNDVDPPYNVRTNLYLSRHTDKDLPGFNPTLFTKRSFHVGNMGPAPWKHSSATFNKNRTRSTKQLSSAIRGTAYDYEQKYVSNRDFDRYSLPCK